jgi:hypothetical protein
VPPPDVAHKSSQDHAGTKDPPVSAQDASESPRMDQNEIPEDFNPCAHFRETINALLDDHNIHLRDATLPVEEPLGTAIAFHAAARVVSALNELLPAAPGVTLTGPDDQNASSLVPSGPKAHDRITLHLQPFGKRTILLLIDFEDVGTGGNAVVHVVDSEPGTTKLRDRQQLHNQLRKTWHIFDTPFPKSLRWNLGPRQTSAWLSGYFAVLNAWSILLGLQLNTVGFFPSESFFHDVRQLLEAVGGGHADWKLIWSFLRCTNYVTDQNASEPGRRFTRTISEKEIKQHEDRLRKRHAQVANLSENHHSDTHFPKDSGFRHSEPSPWDDFDDEDVHTRIPELIRSGRYENNLSRSEIRNLYAGLPKDFDKPCEYFRAERDRMLRDKKLQADLNEFRNQNDNIATVEFTQWLDDEELSLAVAAATLGITNHQNAPLGFSSMTQNDMQFCKMPDGTFEIPQTIRPGRPMLLPHHIASHFILLIIRINDDGVIEFSVMDSKAYHLSPGDREDVHNLALQITSKSGWGRKDFTEDELEANLPEETTWLYTSQQPKDYECGYHVIMNAWSLALGLEPNVDAHIDWNDQFFQDWKTSYTLLEWAR